MINHIEKLREVEVGYSQKYGSSELWSDNNPPNLRSLTKYHTEKWRVRRSIKTYIMAVQRGTVYAQSKGDCLPVLLAIYIQSVYPKKYQESVCYPSVAHCAIGTSTIWRLAPSPPYLRVRYYISALTYHSTFWKNKKS